jgi:hypothetical protein
MQSRKNTTNFSICDVIFDRCHQLGANLVEIAMKPRPIAPTLFLTFFAFSLTSPTLLADDGAASIANGGLVPRRETRIVMAKEVLRISLDKVIVDYDFRNDTDEVVTTEVAFPVPSYENGFPELEVADQAFRSFRLWVDGKPATYHSEAKAILKGKDVSGILAANHIDIPTFGHFSDQDSQHNEVITAPDFDRLPPAKQLALEKAGLFETDLPRGLWTVRLQYYWTQTFPAHSTIHVRHEYTPVAGTENSIKYGLGSSPDPTAAKEFQKFCIDGRLGTVLKKIANSKDKDAPYFWVDFILTTANTWKTPIEDFTLIVERPHQKGDEADYVSFCWNGPVTKIDPDHFSAKAINLVPTKELKIGFFGVTKSDF